jgi:tRNA A-37 threonylcarbamoyl transferase component Bud32
MPDSTPHPPAACARCGAALPAGAAECPRCLLGLGLKDPAPADAPSDANPPPDLPASSPPTLDEVRAAFPDLEIVELLGRGGMGAVFKARQKKLQRTVAIKVLPRALGEDPAFSDRFLREARALAKLSHPGIVTVHDFGESGGLFFLLMEYVDGLDLRHLLRQGLMQPRQALAIVRDLCDALQYAHDEGVVHRDIKPENVLLDTKGRVKIGDFGLAKLLHPGSDAFLSRADQVMGTPHYMAPEQLERPREVDHRADLFSLGVVFYEMLTGSLPRGNFEVPSRRVHVDVRLDEIVLKALEREPERRYQQALEVKTDVDVVTNTPAKIPEPAKPARASRPIPPAKKDWFRGPRALVYLVVMWIVLAALWNAGAFPYGMAIPVAILMLGGLLQSRVRADPELAAAIEDQPRKHQALRVGIAVVTVALGLLAISAGHVLHWERGTEHWKPSYSGILGGFEGWQANPASLSLLKGILPDSVPRQVLLERSFTQSSADASNLSPWLWIGVGVFLLAIGISTAVGVRGSETVRRRPPGLLLAVGVVDPEDLHGPGAVRRRARHLGWEISSYALGALLVLWIGAPIAAFRGEPTLESIEQRVDSPLPFEEAATKLYGAFLEEGLQVDVEQYLKMKVLDYPIGGRVRIYRAQSSSPFDRWSTSWAGPIRETPQIWATLVEHIGAGSTILLQGGVYDSTSDPYARASDEVARIERALAGL